MYQSIAMHGHAISILVILMCTTVCGDEYHGLHDSKHALDKDHIKDHYDGVADFDPSKMTEDELEWHYFKLHDYNNDTQLDGLELLSALSHHHHEDNNLSWTEIKKQVATELKENEEVINTVLQQSDKNNDGLIDYIEFVMSRQLEKQKVNT